jgi:hypothetical protein
MSWNQEKIRQSCQHIDLAAILGQTTQPGFQTAELLIDHPSDSPTVTIRL